MAVPIHFTNSYVHVIVLLFSIDPTSLKSGGQYVTNHEKET